MEGKKGLPHHWKPYEFFRRSSGILSRLLCVSWLKVVQKSQQRRKVTDTVSVVSPNNRKRLTFVGQDAVGWQRARPGRRNVLMKTLHSSGRPYTITVGLAGVLSLAGVLALCPALAHLNLSDNDIGPTVTESLTRVLGQCVILTHLDLSANSIGPPGAEGLASVLTQCTTLTHLNLGSSSIGQGWVCENHTRVLAVRSAGSPRSPWQ